MDDYLTDEFILKLIKLGVLKPELRMALREVLQELHAERDKRARDTED